MTPRHLLQDYRDRRATTRRDHQLIDVLVTLSMVLGISLQVADGVTRLLHAFADVSPTLVRLFLCVAWFLWAAAVIQATIPPERLASQDLVLSFPRPAYRFNSAARLVAKVLCPVLLIGAGVLALRLHSEVRSLPPKLFGYLAEKGAAGPRALPGLRVEVLSREGDLLATSRYETDGVGFYNVRADRPIPRSARLRVRDASRECGATGLLPLSKEFEAGPGEGPVPPDLGSVTFRHTVTCAPAP